MHWLRRVAGGDDHMTDAYPEGGAETLEEVLRRAKRSTAVSVSLLTTHDEYGRFSGLAVTSFAQLSNMPPAMMVSMDRNASTYPILVSTRAFCLNMIHSGQIEVFAPFCRSDRRAHRFSATDWKVGAEGLPYLESALINLFCVVDEIHAFGDHAAFFGRIVAAMATRNADGADPLIWRNGAAIRL